MEINASNSVRDTRVCPHTLYRMLRYRPPTTREVSQKANDAQDNPRLTERGEMDDMGRFILLKKPFSLLWIPVEAVKLERYFF